MEIKTDMDKSFGGYYARSNIKIKELESSYREAESFGQMERARLLLDELYEKKFEVYTELRSHARFFQKRLDAYFEDHKKRPNAPLDQESIDYLEKGRKKVMSVARDCATDLNAIVVRTIVEKGINCGI